MVTFAITGHVNRAAELKSYDITATARGVDADGANSAFTVSGAASDLKVQANGLAIIAPTRVKLSQGARSDDAALMATAMNYARDEGLKFLNNSENVFYKEASCLRTVTTKPHVKRGETATEEVTVFSRITNKRVESKLTLDATGGAEATPKTAETTPRKAAKVKVKMPAKPRGTSVDRRAIAAAAPSVAITGLSSRAAPSGRSTRKRCRSLWCSTRRSSTRRHPQTPASRAASPITCMPSCLSPPGIRARAAGRSRPRRRRSAG